MPSVNKSQPRPKPVHHNSSHLTDQVAQRFSLHRVKFATDLGKLPIIGYITIFCWASPKVASCGETVTMKRFRSSPAGVPRYDMPSFKTLSLGGKSNILTQSHIWLFSKPWTPPPHHRAWSYELLIRGGSGPCEISNGVKDVRILVLDQNCVALNSWVVVIFWFWRVEILNCCIGLKCIMNF